MLYATQRNKFSAGDEVEIVTAGQHFDTLTVEKLYDENGEEISNANHAMMKLSMPCKKTYPKNSIIRMKK